jgi:glycosyltransferase involved in cell wall biosynthesis
MLCNDYQIDRRILAQANTLIEHGHEVDLYALTKQENNFIEYVGDKLCVHRISLLNMLANKYKHEWLKKILDSLLGTIFMNPNFKKVARKIYYYLIAVTSSVKGKSLQQADFLISKLYPFRSFYLAEMGKECYDLVQVHDLPLLELGHELSQKFKVPLIYDSHEFYPEQIVFDKFLKERLIQHEANLIKHCDLVFTVNNSIAEQIKERYKIKKPSVVLNALDSPKELNQIIGTDFFRKHFSIPQNKKVILLQGGLYANRNLENLVKSFAYVTYPNVVLVVMGSGEIEAKLIKIANKLNLLNNKIYFLPSVPQDDLLYYTTSADFGIIPYPPVDLNTYYCTPNKLFEFIQAGLPIIANDLPELRRYVADNGFGIVHSMNNSFEIAQAIDKALELESSEFWKENLLQKRHLYSWHEQGKVYWQEMKIIMDKISNDKNKQEILEVI